MGRLDVLSDVVSADEERGRGQLLEYAKDVPVFGKCRLLIDGGGGGRRGVK